MADVKAVLLDSGKRLITGALTGFSALGPTKFRVGTSAAFEPLSTDTDITGGVVFEGLSGLIQSRRIADDTVRYTMVIPESYGPFQIGNIVMWASHSTGEEFPLVKVVLPFTVSKIVSDPDVGSQQPMPIPGNRFTINITIKHSIDADDVTVDVINPDFASLTFFDNEQNVPPPVLNPYFNFVVNFDTRTGTPSLVSQKDDGTQWGIPFWRNLRDPKFAVIDGGVVGDGRINDGHSFLWGYFYTTPNELLHGEVGGSGYVQDTEYGYAETVGGVAY